VEACHNALKLKQIDVLCNGTSRLAAEFLVKKEVPLKLLVATHEVARSSKDSTSNNTDKL
jgi:hypothetical protein